MSSRLKPCFTACLSLFLCASSQGREPVQAGGSGVGLGGLRLLAKAYERRHPDRPVTVLPSIGSSGGIRAVLDGKLDLGCTARPLRPEEKAPGLTEVGWVTTPFVFATHAATPPEDLTLAGIEDLYAGRRTSWKDGSPIRLILRPKSDSSFAYLAGFTPGMGAALDHAHLVPGVCIGVTDQEALASLEKTPGSFGTTVLGLILSEGRRVQPLRVDGLPPTDPNYPWTLTLALVYRSSASPATRAFLDFIHSKEGQRILTRAGYRPVKAPGPDRGR